MLVQKLKTQNTRHNQHFHFFRFYIFVKNQNKIVLFQV